MYDASGGAGNDYMGYWEVTLIEGPTYDEGAGTTTFIYEVRSLCMGGKDLSHWVLGITDELEIESAAVNDEPYYFSGSGLETDPTTTLYGFKFDDGQPICTTYIYKLVLTGKVCAEEGVFALKAGSNQVLESVAFGVVDVPAECEDEEEETCDISGTVFIDINKNGIFDESEPVIPGVPVKLDGELTELTDAAGLYLFEDVEEGEHTVAVDYYGEGAVPGMLRSYFIPVTPLEKTVSICPDAAGVDFGFKLKTTDIELSGTGRTIGFWKHQLSVITTGKGKAQVAEEKMAEMISEINDFYLVDPFVITTYKSALDILSYSGPEPLKLMLKQLLAAEFNKFYGIGLSDPLLMTLILEIAESTAVFSSSLTEMEILDIKDLLDEMNNLEGTIITVLSAEDEVVKEAASSKGCGAGLL
jgi:hypothetical protein